MASCGRSTKENDSANDNVYVPLSLEQAQKLITPTIYYIPQHDGVNANCSANDVKAMKDKSGKVLANVCPSFLKFCILQGTCKVLVGQSFILLHYSQVLNGDYLFTKVNEGVCRYGYGTKKACVDPFYSVAADLSIYKAGTVIFIPSVVGLLMPDGSFHNGYFIVRDSGQAIKGYGRFDFFTGFTSLDKNQNPLSRAGLAWKGTNLAYFIVVGPEAEQILKSRNYPYLPE